MSLKTVSNIENSVTLELNFEKNKFCMQAKKADK